MAEILIISGSYFPNATANAVCVKKFEDALRARGHHVFYCNRKQDLNQPDTYDADGTEINTVPMPSDLFYQTVGDLKKLELPNGMNGAFRTSMAFFRFLMGIKNLGKSKQKKRAAAQELYHRTYAERIVSLVRERKVDLILSVSMPFHSHLAVLSAMDRLGPDERPAWIVYLIDSYSTKAGAPKEDIPQMKAEEASVFGRCGRILLLDTIEKDFCAPEYDGFREKMTALPLPLFEPGEYREYTDGIEKQDGVTDIVYTGTIYDRFSNMDACLVLIESCAGRPFRFHFMGKIYPDSLEALQKLQSRMPEQIKIYGRMPYSFAKGSMQKADILLNLANDNANQIPSKIFEYMMCCKPVINVYRLAEDVGTAYLKQYPLSFNYHADGSAEQTARLAEWLEDVGSRSVSAEELEAIFHDITTPVVAGRFCDLAEAMIKNKRGQNVR